MTRETVLSLLNNPPVSIAPDGAPLQFIPVSTMRRGLGEIDFINSTPGVGPFRADLSHNENAGNCADAAAPTSSVRTFHTGSDTRQHTVNHNKEAQGVIHGPAYNPGEGR